ncbi:MAG: hypothetical protein ACKVVP_08965 [Chloroflexota bacterium]
MLVSDRPGQTWTNITSSSDSSTSLQQSQHEPEPWKFSPKGIAVRLFLTCWLVYAMHFTTNIVREIYPALSLGDHLSFRVDEYAGMHPDIFEKPGYGWHIGNNPGVSVLAAIPYALLRPITDRVVESVIRGRAASGIENAPEYNSPWPMAREFFRESWIRGFDVKFGMAALIMQALCMAPSSARGAVMMFVALRQLFNADRTALWLALLYAFGTPVFFRTGYLNHNLMLGHIAFVGFLSLWNPGRALPWSSRSRFLLGGLAGGTALLFDYSGLVLLLGLFCYGVLREWRDQSVRDALRSGGWYVVGTLAPVTLLWFYQWDSFGHPFFPGQHWMPPVEWIELGYQGYGLPQVELIVALAFDHRFGLFVSSPLLLLALLCPFIDRNGTHRLPRFELAFLLILSAAFLLFFSGSNYTRLQFNTGIRYLAAIFPFLFIPAAVVIMRLPRPAILLIAVVSVAEAWSLAMYRDVESPLGVLNPIVHVFVQGFQLPALTTLSRLGSAYGDVFSGGVSPLPLFCLAAGLVYAVWSHSLPDSNRSQESPRP